MAENPPNPRPDGSDDPEEPGRQDPFAEMLSGLFGGQLPAGFDPKDLPEGLGAAMGMPNDPEAMQAMFRQVQAMMGAMATGDGGPVNWKLARDSARQATAGSDPAVSPARAGAVGDAGRLAELWLDQATSFTSPASGFTALSRAEWVEKTMDTWKTLTEPVAVSVAGAISQAMREQMPEELKPMLGGAQGMFQNLGGAMFGLQLGTAVGGLAKDVLGSSDIGLPLAGPAPALVPVNVAAFGEGLDVPEQEVLLFAALREAAHTRLFARVPWLRAHVLGAIGDYARGIHIDLSKIEEAVRDIDPSNPESLQGAVTEGLFTPQRTGAQDAALAKLETALALIEGWVDEVVAAASSNLPSAAALRETVRRRRATGGPAEQAFASLVGLELRPRRLRDAAAFWAQVLADRGIEGRDAVWEHPDLMPTAEDLDDPAGFGGRRALVDAGDAELDEALNRLLSGGYDTPAADDAGAASGPGEPDEDGQDDDPSGAGEDTEGR
ncbi:zinc-dependent metalloprotease [Zafaria sp. J156]|uniref:zinc-dependent metalloprotease n=1 Tax=Zafaria sp. J156 TaxID=3116490 RepID=UPI002E77669A|nr:zinc-dependent metalloprotease [Zafaria sp. J156]MEE1620346.1 zinc-dependent metalloprotease [Zafaria sp. J156]